MVNLVVICPVNQVVICPVNQVFNQAVIYSVNKIVVRSVMSFEAWRYTRSGLSRTFSTFSRLSLFVYNCSTVHYSSTGVNISRPMNKSFYWKIIEHVLFFIDFSLFCKEQ